MEKAKIVETDENYYNIFYYLFPPLFTKYIPPFYIFIHFITSSE